MPESPDTSAELAAAQDALNASDLAGAKRHYEAVLARDSSVALAHVGLGQVAFQTGFLDDAAALFDEAYELVLEDRDGTLPACVPWTTENQPLLRAIQGQGLVAYRQGDLTLARERFSLLLRLNPSDEQGASGLLAAIDAGKTWAQTSE